MTRRCSHCSNNGHNSRTCPSRGGGGGASCYSPGGCVRIFGVRLTDGSIIKKSASTSNLSSHLHSSSHSALPSPTGGGSPLAAPANHHHHHRRELGVQVADGYLSDGPAHASNRRGERKKGVPWTEEEHRLFLIGLQKLGKGDWRGIARNYVTSRTPTQVASHAQKYFIRQSNAGRRKRRTSLFDMAPEMAAGRPSAVHETPLPPPMVGDADHPDTIPSLDLSLATDFKPMETSPLETVKEADETAIASVDVSSVVPTFFPAYIPVPFSVWPSLVTSFEDSNCAEASHHHVLKPVPLLPKEPVHVDELVSMSQLSLVENGSGCWDSSPVSLKLLGEPSRQSAFHSNAPVAASNLSKGKNSLIQAV